MHGVAMKITEDYRDVQKPLNLGNFNYAARYPVVLVKHC